MRKTNTALAVLALAFGIAADAPEARAQARFDFDQAPGRLSKAVVPSHYGLSFDLDPAKPRFEAEARISLTLRERQTQLVLNARELESLGVTLQGPDGRTSRLRVTADAPSQRWTLSSGQALEPGRYTLTIRYRGKVNRSGEGLYRTDGTAPMLATQLEPSEARTLFPAFDEPAFRAVFDVTVRAPRGLQVLANMPEQGHDEAAAASKAAGSAKGAGRGGAVTVHRFAPTPPMPSYLVALAVGRFDMLEGEAAGVPLRIVTAPGKRELARYALGVTQQVLPFYNQYFGVPYALPKLDQLAVPSVRQGAMEDWGLISYIESVMLFDPARSGPQTQADIFSVLAHEVAHQWFGNLVTASSWDEIWLNEAFATWLAEKTTDHFNPGWLVPLARRVELEKTLARDAGSATRAIRSGPVDEAQISNVFDSITYAKGGAVIAMLEQWLGPDVFQRGLSAYINGQKYSNATAGDLWHYLSEASGHDVSAVARSWTDQIGYPLVQVEAACREGRTRLTLRQQRFTTVAGPAAAAPTWQTPVRIARGGQRQTLLLDAPERSFDLDGCSDAPLVANADGAGFYRVQYTSEDQAVLLRRFADLAPADKITLFSDSFALVQSGAQPLARWLELLALLPTVQDASRSNLYAQAGDALGWLDRAHAGTPAQAALRAAGRKLFGPELARLGWEPKAADSSDTARLRNTLIDRLARFDDAAVLQRAGELYELDRSGRQALPGVLRNVVIEAAGRGADAARFEQLRAQLLATRSEEERWTLLAALAAGRDASRARTLLALSTSGKLPASQAIWLPGMVARLSDFGELAYAYVLEHWQALAVASGSGSFSGRRGLLPSAADGFNQAAQAERLRADQARLAGDAGAMRAGEVAEAIVLRAAVREREAARLPGLLADWQPR